MLQAAPPSVGSAVRRYLVARAPKKNPGRRMIVPAASPCWADANRARAESMDPHCADLLLADSSPALRARRWTVPVCLRSLMHPPQRPAATVQKSSLSSKVKRVVQPAERSEEHTSELQSLTNLVCRLLLEKKKKHRANYVTH